MKHFVSDWIQYVTSFSQSCVKGFKGEVGVTWVVEASDDMASLHVVIESRLKRHQIIVKNVF